MAPVFVVTGPSGAGKGTLIRGLVERIPELEVAGPKEGDLLILGWGSTYGAIRAAVRRSRQAGLDVSHAHVRYMNPLPSNLAELIGRFDKVLVPELNLGQLARVLRAELSVKVESFTKIQGQPLRISELEARIKAELG